MIVGRCDVFCCRRRCNRRRSRSHRTSSLHHHSHRVCSLRHHRRTSSRCRALVLRAPSAAALVATSSLLTGGSSSSLLITVSSIENQRIRSTRALMFANQLVLLQRTEFLNSKHLLLAQLSEFVNDALFSSVSCKQPFQPPSLMVSITIINGATPKRAVCLDGILPAYYFHPGSGSRANIWLNDLEVMAILADFILVYLPAPTVFLRPPPAINAGPIAKFFHKCPNNAFQISVGCMRGTSM
ncbi:uncharacterized protein LOC130962989 isoform X2 [Arachis stenosperma]|uniref:uncharacterized protein LOC130962989 isoform X2 n=1 Tax=Arachis stenosperma TaxID=217475 RepID=UPI0025AD36D3|nr:uncharacterized protein LOC130962989 isoform X2 [Arachis stenosperma]